MNPDLFRIFSMIDFLAISNLLFKLFIYHVKLQPFHAFLHPLPVYFKVTSKIETLGSKADEEFLPARQAGDSVKNFFSVLFANPVSPQARGNALIGIQD